MYKIMLIFILVFSTNAIAQTGGTKARKIISVGFMALNSSTTQGGVGPTGSSVLTRSEFVWAYNKFGFGAIFDYDLHGSNEKDSAHGIKVEAYLSNFYLELGYLLSAKRAYTDRAIAEETGTGLVYGLGARFSLKGASSGGPFFHASYKLKTQTLKKQDGIDLSEPIKQQDGYPVFGFGYSF
ncbi:MAG: hypothetical protein AABY53_04215 [Bdellovibrionota bacterium]